MKKIVISVTNDLATDQRVHRACLSLQELNYEVLLIGQKSAKSSQLKRSYACKHFELVFKKGFFFYAEYNTRLFFYLLFNKADVLLANDLDTLLPNFLVSKLRKSQLVYDSHELFTEVPELIDKPAVKKFWLYLEKYTLPRVQHCYTVAPTIATHYNNLYKTNFKVIRNLPIRHTKTDTTIKIEANGRKILLYQGSLNIGRGLGLLIETMSLLDNHLLVIAGTGDVELQLKELTRLCKLEDKVLFLGRLSPEELKNITSQAQLGFSLEDDLGLNYRYALPNKIFDYIQAEVPVLISNLPEMSALMQQYQFGEILQERTPTQLAKQIKVVLENDYSIALNKAKKDLVWENEKQHFIAIFENLDR